MLFSIIIPAYNAGKTIEKCLDSVLKQDFFDFEAIVVNDASTDNTEEIVNRYKVKQILLKNNLGPAAARNAGIKQAQGEIAVFIDSDIAFRDSDALSQLAEIFKERTDIEGIIMIKDKISLEKGLTPTYLAYYKYYLWNQPGEFQTSFTTERSAIKKNVFDKIGYFNEKYKKPDVEDFEFGYRLEKENRKVYIARQIKVLHHFETFSQLTRKTLKRSWQWIRLFLQRKKFDTVYSTRERGIKTLVGATVLPLLILSIFIPHVFYALFLIFAVYLFYNIEFYEFLIREGKIHLIPPFVCLDLYFCFLAGLGAGLSTIFIFLKNE